MASLELTILRSEITHCYGPAITYRTNIVDSKVEFEWPGKSVVTMMGNQIHGNGLALSPGQVLDGEMIVRNTNSEDYDRD